jgi:hypothetical protein
MRLGPSPFLLALVLALLGASISCGGKAVSSCGRCPLMTLPATVGMDKVAADPSPAMQDLAVWLAQMKVWCQGIDAEID